jgi:hypothetical protein
LAGVVSERRLTGRGLVSPSPQFGAWMTTPARIPGTMDDQLTSRMLFRRQWQHREFLVMMSLSPSLRKFRVCHNCISCHCATRTEPLVTDLHFLSTPHSGSRPRSRLARSHKWRFQIILFQLYSFCEDWTFNLPGFRTLDRLRSPLLWISLST